MTQDVEPSAIDDSQVDKVFFDADNPSSIICRVWPDLVPYVRAVADVYSRYFLAHENKVRAFTLPDDRDHRIRIKFWDEYAQACAQDRQMQQHNVIHGVCTPDTWRHIYLTDRKKLLWMLTQPANYTTAMRVLLDRGLDRLAEIMDMPLMVRRNGRLEPDVRMITQVLKVFQLVDLRVKGSVVQRMQIEQKSVNVNHNISADGDQTGMTSAIQANLGGMSMAQLKEIEIQLDRIEQKRSRVVALLPESEQATLELETNIKVPYAIELEDGEKYEDYKDGEA